MSMLTHQDLLSRKRKNLFVGREAERRAFRHNFEGEFPEHLYFYIHGQGGIGKSFLVARCETIAREQGTRTPLANEAGRRRPEEPSPLGVGGRAESLSVVLSPN